MEEPLNCQLPPPFLTLTLWKKYTAQTNFINYITSFFPLRQVSLCSPGRPRTSNSSLPLSPRCHHARISNLYFHQISTIVTMVYLHGSVGWKGYVTQFGDKLLMDAAVFIDVRCSYYSLTMGQGGQQRMSESLNGEMQYNAIPKSPQSAVTDKYNQFCLNFSIFISNTEISIIFKGKRVTAWKIVLT